MNRIKNELYKKWTYKKIMYKKWAYKKWNYKKWAYKKWTYKNELILKKELIHADLDLDPVHIITYADPNTV